MKEKFSKLVKWMQNNLVLLISIVFILIVIVLAVVGAKRQAKEKEDNRLENTDNNTTAYFDSLPTPNRLVYKLKGEDCYYIFNQNDYSFVEIMKEFAKGAKELEKEPSKVSEQDIDQIAQQQSYLLLDYTNYTKAYICPLEDENYGMIRLSLKDGEKIKGKLENRDKIQRLLEQYAKNKQAYSMKDNKVYESSQLISAIPELYQKDLKQGNHVSYMKIESSDKLQSFKQNFGVKVEEMPEVDFQKNNIIALVTKAKLEGETAKVNAISYQFHYTEDYGYHVYLHQVSKAVNSDTIYVDTKKETVIKTAEGIRYDGNLANYRIISNNTINTAIAKKNDMEEKENGIYVKLITDKDTLYTLSENLGLKSIGGSYLDNLSSVYDYDNEDTMNYLIVLKNTNGHFEAGIDKKDWMDKGITIGENLSVGSYYLKDSSESHIQGNLIAIPKEAPAEQYSINYTILDTQKFEKNKKEITKKQAIEIAKQEMQVEKVSLLEAYTDVLPKNSFYRDDEPEKTENYRRVWIVCTPELNTTQTNTVVIDATTGEVVESDQLSC